MRRAILCSVLILTAGIFVIATGAEQTPAGEESLVARGAAPPT